MKTSNYWKLREIKAREKMLDTSIAQTEKELRKMYKGLAESLIAQMENAILKMEEGKSISHQFNFQKYYELLEQIQTKLSDLGDKEQKLLNNDMKSVYKKTSNIVDKANKFSSAQIDDKRIEKIINSTWVGDGRNWSQRLWTHQAELSQKLAKGLLDTMEGGIPLSNLKKDLMRSFNVSYSQVNRLVRTEFVHVANEASIDRYKQAGVQKYRFLCTPGERTCEECMQRDGQEFSVEDTAMLPPLHPFCRCSTIAVIEQVE